MINKLTLALMIALVCVGCASNSPRSVLKADKGTQDIKQGDALHLAVNIAEDSVLQGQFDFDELHGGAGGMLYPGYGAASFLVGIAVHAAVANSATDKKKDSVVDRANQVVQKYQVGVDKFAKEEFFVAQAESSNDLQALTIKAAARRIGGGGDSLAEANSWLLTSDPVFYMTQDERELVLQNVVRLTRADEPEKILYENIIEIASVPIHEAPRDAYWLAEGRLEEQLGKLFVDSLVLAADDVLRHFDGVTATQVTFRYNQGGERKIQRGTLVQAQCERVVLRTLRGWLKSLPVSSVEDAELLFKNGQCQPVQPAFKST